MGNINLFELIDHYAKPKGFENFLSVSLAWCLDHDDDFRRHFFGLLGENEIDGWKIEPQKTIEIEGSKFPDLVFTKNTKKCIIVEVKFDQPPDEEQLANYRNWLDNEEYQDKKLFLLAKYLVNDKSILSKLSDREKGVIYWSRISDNLDRSPLNKVTQEFLQYLEKEGIIVSRIPDDVKKKLDELFDFKGKIGKTMLDFLNYSYYKLLEKYHFQESSGRSVPHIASDHMYYWVGYPFEIHSKNSRCYVKAIFVICEPIYGIVPGICIEKNKTSPEITAYIQKTYEEGEYKDYYEDESDIHLYLDYEPEKYDTAESQREEFAKAFIETTEELLSLKD